MLIRIISFIVGNQLWISLAAVLFYRTGSLLLTGQGLSKPGEMDIVIFFSTFLLYNLPRIHRSFDDLEQNRMFIFSCLVAILITLAAGLMLDWDEMLYLMHLGLISFYYQYPFHERKISFLPIRTIPLLKIGVIAYVWASIGSVLYPISQDVPVNAGAVANTFAAQFLFIFTITIPFDIRDYAADRQHRILTLPLIMGIAKSKILAYVLILVFIFSGALTGQDPYPFIIMGVIVFLLVLKATERRPQLYFTGIIDGSIILYWLILSVFSG